jgi:plasmid stabilization system protein ParE
MKVHWTKTALDQLQSIHDYIACNSPYYAKRMVDRITRRSIQISQFPLSGRTVPEYDMGQIREVLEADYRIIYYTKSDGIDVLAVFHGSQSLP